MGVTGLWKLIEASGKPVPVDTLEGKILAVDISIWLHQTVKGFQDNQGSALAHAHLLGLFHRLCKLLYYRVKPIFVFDGCVPQLKRDTIARRQQQRNKLNNEADRIQALLLQSLAKEKVVQQALGATGVASLLLKSPNAKVTHKNNGKDNEDDMFKLPKLPSSSNTRLSYDEDEVMEEGESDLCESSFSCNDEWNSPSGEESSSLDESSARNAYNINLQALDVRSQHFRNLPADIRHEILVDIKETRKQSSWGRLHELPSRSNDFSSFQMKRLLKRRAVQESLEDAEKEMGGRSLTYAELQNYFTEEGILGVEQLGGATKQICSDEHTRFLLVRDMKKQICKVEKDEEIRSKINQEKDDDEKVRKTESTKICEIKGRELENMEKSHPDQLKTHKDGEEKLFKLETKKKDDQNQEIRGDTLGKEYEADLQLAMALSLESSSVYNEKDYNYESNEQLKLNREQRKHLKDSATGPARSYMIEYGGMNVEEVEDIMEKTQTDLDDIDCLLKEHGLSAEPNENDTNTVVTENNKKSDKCENHNQKVLQPENSASVLDASSTCTNSQDIYLRVSDASSDDSDFEEVPESEEIVAVANDTTTITPESPSDILEIKIDLKESIPIEDDIFADVFESESKQNVENEIENKQSVKTKNEEVIEDTSKKIPNTDIQSEKPSKNSTKIEDANTAAILEDLRRQLNEMKNLKLEDIKIKSSQDSVIEISDDEVAKDTQKSIQSEIKKEIIEIYDSDDGQRHMQTAVQTPPTTPKSMRSQLANISPNLKTPSKNHSISDYFQTDYVIKRTPETPKQRSEEDENVPTVKSPFFIRKTPKSKQKASAQDSPRSSSKDISKISKSLFKETEEAKEEEDTGLTRHVHPLESTETVVSTENLINEAAQLLKGQSSDKELQTIASDLAKERRELEMERNRQDRMGTSITQRMNLECQELLRLFGIPYLVAPMEAEAQCAFLDMIDVTNGTITDDSDIWLFGGQTVYKNFFAQNKHVLEFSAEKIENTFSCDRKKLIQLACLVGSDYTIGVHGIGAVTALEILASFSAGSPTKPPPTDHGKPNTSKILETLSRFRDWWLSQRNSSAVIGNSTRLGLRKKLKNIELYDGFPNGAVIEAYLLPKVDDSREPFSWGEPDVESIVEFARKTFGWTRIKTNDILAPVLKRIHEKKSQSSIRNYFSITSALATRPLSVSKRVQKAIDKMSGKIEVETPEKQPKPKAKRGQRKRKQPQVENEDQHLHDNADESNIEASTETIANINKLKRNAKRKPSETVEDVAVVALPLKPEYSSKRKPRIPETKQVIPQRENDKKQMEINKAKAAEILKKSKASIEETVAQKKRKT